MNRFYKKAISVAFVFNTALSLSVPLTTYANDDSNSQKKIEQIEYGRSVLDKDQDKTDIRQDDNISKKENGSTKASDQEKNPDLVNENKNEEENETIPIKESESEAEEVKTDEKNEEQQEIHNAVDEPDNTIEGLTKEDIKVTTYIESKGWQEPVNQGDIAGTENKGLKLESFKVKSSHPELSIRYRTFSRNSDSWMPWKENDQLSNPVDTGDQIEAVQFDLTGAIAEQYDVFYRVHSKTFGWLGWAKNGEHAGTKGYDYQIEAIEIRVVSINDDRPEQTLPAYEVMSDSREKVSMNNTEPMLTASAHVQSYGWMDTEESLLGVTGQSKRLEALKLVVDTGAMQGGIEYRSLVDGNGWQAWKRDGKLSGTEGQAKHIEAIEVRLYGEIAKHYDIVYKAHVQSFGWMGSVLNGMPSGTEKLSKRMEALDITIVKKGTTEKPSNDGFRYPPKVQASAHVQSYGWLEANQNDGLLGVTGRSKRLEALKLVIDAGAMQGGIEYRGLVQGEGWEAWKRDGQLSGTEGQAKRLEAIEIRLYGEIAEHYDVVYKSHVQSFGWLGSVLNGMPSGTEKLSKRMEALEIQIVEKNTINSSSEEGFIKPPSINASAHVQSYGWMKSDENESIVGTIGKSKRLEALNLTIDTGKLSGGITYRSRVEGEGWQYWKRDGEMSGTEGKGLRLEAVEIRLYGEVAKYYDVAYKTHVESFGWLGAVINGMTSGTQMLSKRTEAIQVDLVKKNSMKADPDKGFKRAPIVFIDIGHGGKDPGASYFGLKEADISLSTGLKVINSLREKGFDVRSSRETNKHLELKERSTMSNKIKPDILFSIHYNSMGGNNWYARGIETFIYHRVASGFGQETDRNKFKTEDKRIAESLKLADLVHNSVIHDTKFYNRGVKGNNFHMLREPESPAALIELGFIDNIKDNAIIKTKAYHQLAADAIVKGIVAYFGDW
ncbi:N-acetylmuramoyl-L-alanine amidase [Alkalibacterium gilvum]|uniref:N-acetylmuramoyl-L-alanine amidase n=1 Tax=Alkalibacterium gilvum TaxID=1130080 RepID=A0A1H6VRR8_9LACT|nr:N-acetylmuramoyl-L-alanine amidase [Alkalibacterium gilvum]SEJ05774.1 N-acetylmuramoyl-L-alanine amidase [Alkalibacterium gilvum]